MRFRFGDRTYKVGDAYEFEELPEGVQDDVVVQLEFERVPADFRYRLVVVPHETLMGSLEERYGTGLGEAIDDQDIADLAENIRARGLQLPPVGDEGWHRALAVAKLGWDLPYFVMEEKD